MRVLKLDKALKRYLKPVTPSSVFDEIEAGKARVVLVSKTLVAVIRMELKTMVIVSVRGSKLYQSRGALISLAQANGAMSVRFHTKHPERLERAAEGLGVQLLEVRKSLLGRDEYVYSLGVM